ncbi:conserved hypothetical protein [Vibrio parahaemolyticus K5030]|nr:conserved hypothetical protein [Vibrio parahaemolyticus K5030]
MHTLESQQLTANIKSVDLFNLFSLFDVPQNSKKAFKQYIVAGIRDESS